METLSLAARARGLALVSVDESFRDRHICIVGLGYVGLTLAATMASVGFRVTGIEVRSSVLDMLQSGQPHFQEPGLNQMLAQGIDEGFLEWCGEIPKCCKASVYIITVGTPLNEHGSVNLDMIERVTREIAGRAKPGSLVILRSTVMIGTTRKLVLPILQELGVDLSVAFCPERTIEGQALRELRELPQIVGAPDLQTLMRATQIFQFLTSTIVRVGSFEAAEMIKLIDNVQRDGLVRVGKRSLANVRCCRDQRGRGHSFRQAWLCAPCRAAPGPGRWALPIEGTPIFLRRGSPGPVWFRRLHLPVGNAMKNSCERSPIR